ncbi:MAG: hypothetical protein AAF587_33550 [Bacteroidota bacterium]
MNTTNALGSIILFFCLMTTQLVLGQQRHAHNQDVLYLKNGWVLRGWVLSDVLIDSVKIETEGGNIFVFAKNDIRSQTVEPKRRKRGLRPYTPSPIKRGYYGYLQFGILAGSEVLGSNGNLDLMTGHGFRFAHWGAIGGGAGITFLPNGALMPVFVEARSQIRKVGSSFFGYGKGGYSLPLYERNFSNWGLTESKVSGGLLGEVGIGLRIPTPRKMGWMISVGYRIQQNKETFIYEWNEMIERTSTYRRILISLGIEL